MRQILDFGFVLRYGNIAKRMWLALVFSSALILSSGTCLMAQTGELSDLRLPNALNRSDANFPPPGFLIDRNSTEGGSGQANPSDPTRFAHEPAAATCDSASKESQIASTLGQWKDVVVQQFSKVFRSNSSNSPDFKRVFASLAIVVGGYFGLVWLSRMISPQRNSQLPNDVVEVLGKTPFGAKQNLQLVRLGSKLILMLEGNDTVQPIAEISDPGEVHQVLNLCEPRHRKHSSRFSNLNLTQSTPVVAPVNRNLVNAVNDPVQTTLADLVRVIESATRQNVTRRTSFEG